MTDDPGWDGETRRIGPELLRDHLDGDLAGPLPARGPAGDGRGRHRGAARGGHPRRAAPARALQRAFSATAGCADRVPARPSSWTSGNTGVWSRGTFPFARPCSTAAAAARSRPGQGANRGAEERHGGCSRSRGVRQRGDAASARILTLIGTAGVAAASASVVLALASDHVTEPGLQSALIDWITLPYILGGLVAWWRRPESRFGPLMVAAGFVDVPGDARVGDHAVPFTRRAGARHAAGGALPARVPRLPDGRLSGASSGSLVAGAYAAAIGLELVRMVLGDYGPHNLLGVRAAARRRRRGAARPADRAERLCLAGVGVLADAAAARRPAAAPLALVADRLVRARPGHDRGLLRRERLRCCRAWSRSGAYVLRDARAGAGRLPGRAARRAAGPLGGRRPARRAALGPVAGGAARRARPRAARSVADARVLAARVRRAGRTWTAARRAAGARLRPGDDADRPGRRARWPRWSTTRRSRTSRELLDAVGAAAGIALENGRLHAEQRAQLEELKGSRARVIEAGQRERQRLERNLHDGAQQRLIALSLELSLLEERLGGRSRTPGAARPGAERDRDVARRAARGRARAASGGRSPATGWRSRSSDARRARRCRSG